jgi:hypothetical protein
MTLASDLILQLAPLAGQAFVPPRVLTASDAAGVTVSLYCHSVEVLGCALEGVEMHVPRLAGANADTLKQWAGQLCGRLTYLLESLNPIEFDAEQAQVLIRSNPPATNANSTRYYEVLLSTLGNGRFVLKRYEAAAGQPRMLASLNLTYEQLEKLISDLCDTAP